MALKDRASFTVDLDIISAEFREFTTKEGEKVAFWQIVGIADDELVAMNTTHSSAELLKSGERTAVKLEPAGYANVRLPKYKLNGLA